MSITPAQFATGIFYLNRMPLKMPHDSMRHLFPIYNKQSNAMMFKFGRQTHKSTTIAFKLALPAIKYPSYHALYVAPTGNQISVFSTDKLNSALHESSMVKDHYFDTRTKDQVSYKEMKNGSKIYLRSAFHTADSIRGISTDFSAIDEIQDIVSDHIPVIEQSMSHSLAKWESLVQEYPDLPMHLFNCKLYAGTPKTVENTMEKYWEQSTQGEWVIKCQNTGCKKWNFINEYNIGDTCLICNKCGKPIYYRDGQWVTMNNNDPYIDGFRLPQIVLNWVNNEKNPQAWQVNVIQTRKIYSTEKYFNEVLALPYAAAKHPLSVAEIKACCQDYMMIEPERAMVDKISKNSINFAGIDWGKGDTASGTSYSIITIGAWHLSRFKVLFKKKYTGRLSAPIPQVKDMIRIINKFQCTLTIADTGDGRTSNAIVVEALGVARFGEIYEHGSLKKKIRWDKDKGYYIMNRTQIMTDMIMEIKKKEVDFFMYDQFKEFQPDFTGIYSEYSEQLRMTKYDHNVPDDAFHSYMFSRIACKIMRGEYSKYITGGADTFSAEEKSAISL